MSDTIPAEIVQRTERLGHTVESDPPAALTAAERWTCTKCGGAVLRYNGNVYGSATTEQCEDVRDYPA